jgi:hypothetical protein
MKKLSVVVLVLLFVSMVTYGYDPGNWENDGQLPETWTSSGGLGIGTDEPEELIHVKGTYPKLYLEATNSKWKFYPRYDGSLRIQDITAGTSRLMIDDEGNVGIGTTTPDNKLDVNGTIRAKEIKVETGWSDFVFADDYNLMPLDKLERHIKANKSLPGIPTEKVVLENGVSIGEMQAKFLEKIEELTLYVIDLKKENVELKERMSILEKQ